MVPAVTVFQNAMQRRPRGRLPLRHPARLKERDAKLLRREIEVARNNNQTTLFCPCRVCKRGPRSNYSFQAVMKHIKAYDYDDWQRGSTEVILIFILHF